MQQIFTDKIREHLFHPCMPGAQRKGIRVPIPSFCPLPYAHPINQSTNHPIIQSFLLITLSGTGFAGTLTGFFIAHFSYLIAHFSYLIYQISNLLAQIIIFAGA